METNDDYEKCEKDGENLETYQDSRQAWQVVSCPVCKMPPGMRCKGRMIRTHYQRKKFFIEKMEDELAGDLEKIRKQIEDEESSDNDSSPRGFLTVTERFKLRDHGEKMKDGGSLDSVMIEDDEKDQEGLSISDVDASSVLDSTDPTKLEDSRNILLSEKIKRMTRTKISHRMEDTSVWLNYSCPICRAPSGVKCFDTLGEIMFKSHAMRGNLNINKTQKN